MGDFTIAEVEKMCEDLGVGVLINDGKIVGFEGEDWLWIAGKERLKMH